MTITMILRKKMTMMTKKILMIIMLFLTIAFGVMLMTTVLIDSAYKGDHEHDDHDDDDDDGF